MENIEIHGISRGAFLVRGALATGAAYGAASVAPWVTRAMGQEGGGDVDILNFALTLEYLEADFYKQASKLSLKGDYKSLAKDFGANEQEHVDALIATIGQLGGEPVKSPKFAFGLKSQKDFEKLAITLEDTGVSAYNGAAPMIESKEVLAAAGSIVQVEARHAAALRFLGGMKPTLGAFDKTLDKAAVLKAVKPLITA
jgi:rubrerythrin